jgi:hypothetical protein
MNVKIKSMNNDLIRRLRRLGQVLPEWPKHPHNYFEHSNGKVSLDQASKFYDVAVMLAEEAANEIERLSKGSLKP